MRKGPALLLAGLLIGAAAAPPDTVVVLMDSDVEGLDPHTSGELAQTRLVFANLYESLVTTNATMTLQPGLAASWSNPDDLTWDFRLRAGVRFHDGRPMEMEDVRASFERARSHPRSVVRSTLSSVSEMTPLGPDTFRFRTREPDAFFPSGLVEIAVVSRRCLGPDGSWTATGSCGTGPYRLDSRVPGKRVDVSRFEGYWRGPAAIPKARFVARSILDPDALSFVPPSGRLVFGGSFPPREDARLRRLYSRRPMAGLSMTYLGFDLRSESPEGVRVAKGPKRNPFKDPRVRQAIALGVSSARLGSVEEGTVPTQPVPSFVFGYDPSLPQPRFDPAAARKLLAAAGYPSGFEVDLDVRSVMSGYAAPIAEDLAEIGVRARPLVLTDREFFPKVQNGRSALYVLRFSCRSGDAQEFLDKWAHSKRADEGLGLFNYSYDVSPAAGLDAGIEAARRDLSPVARQAKLQAALGRVMSETLLVPLLARRNVSWASEAIEWTPRPDNLKVLREMKFRD